MGPLARLRRRAAGRRPAPEQGPGNGGLESRLLWIFGSPRTGSTWLLRQICHPLRLSANFPLGFSPPRAWRDEIDALPVDEFLVSRHIAPLAGEPVDTEGGLVPATLNNYVGEFPGYAFASAYEDVWRPELRRLVLARLEAMLRRCGREGIRLSEAPMVAIKEVNGSHASDLVMSLFPSSRMLFLLRDGRDVLDSRLHAHAEGGWLAEKEGPRFRDAGERQAWVRTACREWTCNIEVTRRAYESHPQRLRTIVRYEELIADPEAVLSGLFDWLGLDRDPDRVGRIVSDTAFEAIPAQRRGSSEPFRAATPGLWRENLSAAEIETAEEIMGPSLRALGY